MLSNKLTLKFLWFYPQEKLSLTHTAQPVWLGGVGILLHMTLSNQSAGW